MSPNCAVLQTSSWPGLKQYEKELFHVHPNIVSQLVFVGSSSHALKEVVERSVHDGRRWATPFAGL